MLQMDALTYTHHLSFIAEEKSLTSTANLRHHRNEESSFGVTVEGLGRERYYSYSFSITIE